MKNFESRYEQIVYKHRNCCAHNTLSYQSNKPDLEFIASEDYDYCNYFFRYSIMVVIDEIFVKLFEEYQRLYNENM